MASDKKSQSALETLRAQMAAFSTPMPLREIQDQLKAGLTPSYLTDIRAQMADIASPSHLSELRAQMAQLQSPSYLADLRAQMAEIASPSYLSELRAKMAQLQSPSYLADLRAQMAELASPSYVTELRAQMTQAQSPSYLAALRAQMAQVQSPSYLADLRAQLAQVTNPSYLDDLRASVKAFTSSSYVTSLRERLKAISSSNTLAHTSGELRNQYELAALKSFDKLLDTSPLADFLVDIDEALLPSSKSPDDYLDGTLEPNSSSPLYDPTNQALDIDIVNAIKAGETAELPPHAVHRFHAIYAQIICIWDMFIRIFDTYMAVAFLTALTTGVTAPTEIPKQIEKLPSYERQLLADYRIVNKIGSRLRAEPNKSSEILLLLELGTPVEVLDRTSSGWLRVSVDINGEYVEGWIYVTLTMPIKAREISKG